MKANLELINRDLCIYMGQEYLSSDPDNKYMKIKVSGEVLDSETYTSSIDLLVKVLLRFGNTDDKNCTWIWSMLSGMVKNSKDILLENPSLKLSEAVSISVWSAIATVRSRRDD